MGNTYKQSTLVVKAHIDRQNARAAQRWARRTTTTSKLLFRARSSPLRIGSYDYRLAPKTLEQIKTLLAAETR